MSTPSAWQVTLPMACAAAPAAAEYSTSPSVDPKSGFVVYQNCSMAEAFAEAWMSLNSSRRWPVSGEYSGFAVRSYSPQASTPW